QADPIMVTGRGLDPWSPVPLIGYLKLIGLVLRADGNARKAYAQMVQDPAYLSPTTWEAAKAADYDGLFLSGGHRARGMGEFLESARLQALGADLFAGHQP